MKNFKNILYVTNRELDQQAAIERAVSLAENNQASLSVLEVIPLDPERKELLRSEQNPANPHDVIRQRRLRVLQALTADHRKRVPINLNVTFGKTFIEVIHSVLQQEHDLVIKPAESPGWASHLFGSDDMHLLRKCPCPVWLTRPGETANYANIVAAIDFTATGTETAEDKLNQDIIELAGSLALSDFANLHLVHVWDVPEAGFVELWADDPNLASASLYEGEAERHNRGMEKLRQNVLELLGQETYNYLDPHFHMLQGDPKTLLPQTARELNADLVVMGTVARTGIAGLFIGNTAEAVLHQLQCSVLAIKPPGFETPVRL